MAKRGWMTVTRRTPLELKRFGPVEGESVLSTGPCTTPIRSLPSRRELSVVPGARRTVRGSVTAIAALVSSRPPVIILRRRVLAQPIHLWSVLAQPICLWSVIGVVYALCKHGSFFEVAHAPYCKFSCCSVVLQYCTVPLTEGDCMH